MRVHSHIHDNQNTNSTPPQHQQHIHMTLQICSSVTEVHVEFKKSGFDLSRTTLYRIMHSQRRPVRPIRTHKVRSVNCKRRVDFCIDMLSRLHRFDQMQGMHRRIPVKLRRVPEHMALDPARLCFQDEALMRCSQKLVPQHQRVWIDRGMSKDFATTDERLSQHMFPVTVSRSLCSAASHDVSHESLFTATELSAVKPWFFLSH